MDDDSSLRLAQMYSLITSETDPSTLQFLLEEAEEAERQSRARSLAVARARQDRLEMEREMAAGLERGDGVFDRIGGGGGDSDSDSDGEPLRCFSSAFDPFATTAQQQRSEGGNKARVPATYLSLIGSDSRPLFLQLTPLDGGDERSKVVGIESFTAESGEIYVPNRVFVDMQLRQPGDVVRVRRAQLPSATRLTFRPRSDDFSLLQNPKRALELSMSQWPCIGIGDELVVREAEQTQLVTVTAVEPLSELLAVSLVNTRVEIDFEPAEQQTLVAQLALDAPTPGAAPAGQYARYCLPPVGEALHGRSIKISLTDAAGQPSIFCSHEQRPTITDFVWCSDDSDDLVVLPSDPSFDGSRSLYIAVGGSDADVAFTVRAALVTAKSADGASTSGSQADEAHGHQLGRASASRPGCVVCDLCQAQVPKAALSRHRQFCAVNYTCPLCLKSVPRADAEQHQHEHCSVCSALLSDAAQRADHAHCPHCRQLVRPAKMAKHVGIFHTPIRCSCGLSLPLRELQQHHQSDACPFRRVTCDACQAVVIARDLPVHTSECLAVTRSETALPEPSVAASSSQRHDQLPPPPPPPQQQQQPFNDPDADAGQLLDETPPETSQCPYCDRSLLLAQLEPHVASCPSALNFLLDVPARPEVRSIRSAFRQATAPVDDDDSGACPLCNAVVRNVVVHAASCQGLSPAEACPYCQQMAPDLPRHLLTCSGSWNFV